MKSRVILFYSLFLIIQTLGQSTSIDLTFIAVNNTTHIQIDSIKVMNRTQGRDTILYWPDTVLSIYFTEIPGHEQQVTGFKVLHNYPNPVTDLTTISLYVPEKDEVIITVLDLSGRLIYKTESTLDRGNHSFRFSPGISNLYLFQAQWRGNTSSIKILHARTNSNSVLSLEYQGSISSDPQLKLLEEIQDFTYALGDQLLFIAYKDTLESGFPDIPEESQTYTFQFATNIPCPGTPVITYEGKSYNTIQIFSQCWLKENLDVGQMILKTMEPSDNGTIEKYCYNDEQDSCIKFGGLYKWDEMMNYAGQEEAQGICPEGWHLPSDEEWKILEGAVDSQFKIGNLEWDQISKRGYDVAGNLKSSAEWIDDQVAFDRFGFSALPGGYLYYVNGEYEYVGVLGHWWTSSIKSDMTRYHRSFMSNDMQARRTGQETGQSFSVRCLRDEHYINPIELTFTAVNNTSHIQLDSIIVLNQTKDCKAFMIGPDTSLALEYELEFEPGDICLMIGYKDTLQSGITDSPTESRSYTFQFATNIPCPGTPTVEYEGQVYNTIQIFSQCWLKENLNAGEMIPGTIEQSNNGIIEKYCYNNEFDSCTKYGGLYQWNEAMLYTTTEGTQGICPAGWHLPKEEDWRILIGAVDSEIAIGDSTLYIETGNLGTDAGTNLKSNTGWIIPGNGTDLYGFTALPSGYLAGGFGGLGIKGNWWSTIEVNSYYVKEYTIHMNGSHVIKGNEGKPAGDSVRCIKNE